MKKHKMLDQSIIFTSKLRLMDSKKRFRFTEILSIFCEISEGSEGKGKFILDIFHFLIFSI